MEFTQAQLVSFGEYLLSDRRTLQILNMTNEDSLSFDERVKVVYDADIANWKDEQGKESKEA